jgi:hypothetical protein
MNRSLILARQAHLSLIYVWSNIQLHNNTQTQKPIYKPISPLFMFLIHRHYLYRKASIHEVLEAGKPT